MIDTNSNTETQSFSKMRVRLAIIGGIIATCIVACALVNPIQRYRDYTAEKYRVEAQAFLDDTTGEKEEKAKMVRTADTSPIAEWAKEREQKDAVNKEEKEAMDAVWGVWDYSENVIIDGATHEAIDSALTKVNGLPESDTKAKLGEGLSDANQMLTDRENAAREATFAVWDAEGGFMREGTTREMITDAQEKISILPDCELKTELLKMTDAADAEMSDIEHINAAKEALAVIYDDESGEIRDDITLDQIEEAQEAVDECPDGEIKDKFQSQVTESKKQLVDRIEAEKRAARDAKNNTIPYDNGMGNAGTLYIPDVGISVKLNYSDGYNDQATCDAWNSAVYCPGSSDASVSFGVADYIADHTNQGFNAIKSAEVGYTKAYIVHPDGSVSTYVCTARFNGHNTGELITDWDYNDLFWDNEGGVTMYTCNENWQNITVTYWR